MGTPLSSERRKDMAERALGLLDWSERCSDEDAVLAIARAHVYALLSQ